MAEGTERVEATRRLIPPNYAAETCRLIERLEQAQTRGETELAYSELGMSVGLDVSQGKGASNLASARRYCLRVHRIVWHPVRGEKRLKRLDDPERVGLVASRTRSVHRATRRTMQMAATIDRAQLPDTQQAELRALVVSTGTIRVMSEQKTIKALAASDGNVGTPNVTKLLEVMKT